jgi:hypothetical protein
MKKVLASVAGATAIAEKSAAKAAGTGGVDLAAEVADSAAREGGRTSTSLRPTTLRRGSKDDCPVSGSPT